MKSHQPYPQERLCGLNFFTQAFNGFDSLDERFVFREAIENDGRR